MILTPHPMAGKPMKIKNGKLAGKYFIVVDWIVNQFQGKSIERLMKSQHSLLAPVKGRGHAVDDKVVFGKLYPTMNFICVHDDELKDAEPAELTGSNVISMAELRKIKAQAGGQDDSSGETVKGHSGTTEPGEPGGADGHSVSSGTGLKQVKGTVKVKGQTDSTVGSTVGGQKQGKGDNHQRKAPKGIGTKTPVNGKGSK